MEGSASIFGGGGSVAASVGAFGCARGGGGVKTAGLFRVQHDVEVMESAMIAGRSRDLYMACYRGKAQMKSGSPPVFTSEVDSTIMQLHSPVCHR